MYHTQNSYIMTHHSTLQYHAVLTVKIKLLVLEKINATVLRSSQEAVVKLLVKYIIIVIIILVLML